MAVEDRYRFYVEAQRKALSLQRASNLVLLAFILLVLAGLGVGLVPELEKLRQLDRKIAIETERRDAAKAELREKQERSELLVSDLRYMEREYRNISKRAAKPGETLILLPEETIESYE